jgi:hypothetical protein
VILFWVAGLAGLGNKQDNYHEARKMVKNRLGDEISRVY